MAFNLPVGSTPDSGGRLATTKSVQGTVGLSTFLRAEHTIAGAHSAFTGNNVDDLYVRKNVGTPASKVDVVFDRITVYDSNGDNPAIRTKKEVQSTGVITLTADITEVGAGGRESGSTEGASEWWYLWVIWGTDPTNAFLSPFSTYGTMTLPSNFTHALLVGRVYNNADSDFDKPEAAVSAGAEKYVVPFDVEHDYSNDGYHMFGSRDVASSAPFMVQWGTETVGTETLAINLPHPYRQAHLIAIATRATADASPNLWYAQATSLTQLTIVNGAGSLDFNWLSIGI